MSLTFRDQYEVFMCDTHMERFLFGLGLDHMFNATDFPCDYFYDPDVIRGVFGDEDLFHSFSYHMLSRSTVRWIEQQWLYALSKTDFIRAVRDVVTNDWANMSYHEKPESNTYRPARTMKPEHVNFFANFMFKYCSAFGDVEHFDAPKTLYCWVYLVSKKIQMYYPSYVIDSDAFWIVASTSKEEKLDNEQAIASFENVRHSGLELFDSFEVPLSEVSESSLVKFLRQVENHYISGRDDGTDDGRDATWQVRVRTRFSKIGLRHWSTSEQIFEY